MIDYRYLNCQSRDNSFPLPLIENLIGYQAENRIWSILDLEDGFHQMHLAEESRHLTAFVTPWGTFEFTVLPMGVKNGPAMFQRMIMWILREVCVPSVSTLWTCSSALVGILPLSYCGTIFLT